MNRAEILAHVEDALDVGARENFAIEDVPESILATMIQSIEQLDHSTEKIEMILFGKDVGSDARLWLLTNERLIIIGSQSDPADKIALSKIRSVEEYGKTLFVRCDYEPSPMISAFDMRRGHKMAKVLRLMLS
jgi:hypothetical protein